MRRYKKKIKRSYIIKKNLLNLIKIEKEKSEDYVYITNKMINKKSLNLIETKEKNYFLSLNFGPTVFWLF